MNRKVVFFDFDGTLYPFAPIDSEDLLICLGAETKEEKAYAEDLRIRDEKGLVSPQELTDAEQRLIIGRKETILDEDALFISNGAGERFLEPLRQLKEAGMSLYVITCGIAEIAERFLKLQKVEDIFDGVYGKHLRIKDDIITDIDYSEIGNSEDKKSKACEIMNKFPGWKSVAVGDGVTDLPVFSMADRAVFIDHGFTPFVQTGSILKTGYPITKTIEELTDFILEC